MTVRRSLLALALLIILAPAARGAEPRGLGPSDLEGTWTRKIYLDAVRKTRSPLAEAAEVVSFEANGRLRMSWTNFQEASWRVVVAVSSGSAPGEFSLALGPWESEDVEGEGAINASLRVSRGKDGRLASLTFSDVTFVSHAFEPFVRIPEPLASLVNRIAVVGVYRDARGRVYQFSEVGVAETPDGPYTYEVQLDGSEAGCDYLKRLDKTKAAGWTPVGFRWRAGKLELLKVVEGGDSGPPLSCLEPPLAVLTPAKVAP